MDTKDICREFEISFFQKILKKMRPISVGTATGNWGVCVGSREYCERNYGVDIASDFEGIPVRFYVRAGEHVSATMAPPLTISLPPPNHQPASPFRPRLPLRDIPPCPWKVGRASVSCRCPRSEKRPLPSLPPAINPPHLPRLPQRDIPPCPGIGAHCPGLPTSLLPVFLNPSRHPLSRC